MSAAADLTAASWKVFSELLDRALELAPAERLRWLDTDRQGHDARWDSNAVSRPFVEWFAQSGCTQLTASCGDRPVANAVKYTRQKEGSMNLKRSALRVVLPVAVVVLGTVAVTGCTDRRPEPTPTPKIDPAPPPATTTPSTPTPAPTTGSPPVIAPSTATDVETKKGTETGMIGGESGTVPSSGKPGQGTASGAGTGPAQSSGEETVNKK